MSGDAICCDGFPEPGTGCGSRECPGAVGPAAGGKGRGACLGLATVLFSVVFLNVVMGLM